MRRYLCKIRGVQSIRKCHDVEVSPVVHLQRFSTSRDRKIQFVDETKDSTNISSLFREITDILGAADVGMVENGSRVSFQYATSRVDDAGKEYLVSREGACENAKEKVKENCEVQSLKDTEISETDVSPVVHEITRVVRGENGVSRMEDVLEKSSFQYSESIVNKVLKRSFKVPELAYRFFSWVRHRDGFRHTTETYNTMLSIAGEARVFWLIEKLLEKMESDLCEKDVRTWTIVIKSYGKANTIGRALTAFEKMRKSGCDPDALAYMTVIGMLCTAQKSDISMEFYKEMVAMGWGMNVNSYRLLLNCLASSGDFTSVHTVAEDMARVSQIPVQTANSCVLKCFCISGSIKEALELIRDCRDLMSEPENLQTLVKGLCRANRIDDALEIVGIMKKKHSVDAKVYEILIDGYLRMNDLYNALDLFESIKDSGHSPSGSIYTALMQRHFRLNKYSKGCEIYDEMVKRGIEPDSVAITAMVAGHAAQNRISEAWAVFKCMEEKGFRPTMKSCFIFIKELSKNSQTDEVIKVLEYMHASGIEVADEIIRWVVKYLRNNGDINLVEEIQKMLRSSNHNLRGMEVEVCSNNVHELDEPNLSSTSNKTEADMESCKLVVPKEDPHNEHDLQKILRVLSSSRDWHLIQEALEKCFVQCTPELVEKVLCSSARNGYVALCFFSWVAKQDGYWHTTRTYNTAIKVSGSGKDFKHMRNLYYEMKRKGCLVTSDTWTIMIMQYAKAGLTEIALKNFQEMKDDGYEPTSSTYKFVIIFLCGRKGRKVKEATETFREMLRANHVPDKELVETYLDCLCEEGKLLDARKCAESLHRVGYTTPHCYSFYIRSLCRAGKLEEALALVDEIKQEHPSVEHYVYGSLVNGLLQKGQIDKALAKVDCMKRAGIKPTVHVYTSFITHFLKEKQLHRALEMLTRMQEEGCQPTIVTYSAMLCGYMEMDKVEDAWDVFNRLKQTGPKPDFKTYSMFINRLCKMGRSEEALKLLSEMPENGIVPSSVNFQTVFYGLNREGKQELANSVSQKKLALKTQRQFLSDHAWT